MTLTTRPRYAPAFEVVECKGLGHPDTLCDRAAETLGRHLAEALVEHTGRYGHFNVDKGLLVGGRVEVDYGGGHLVTPVRLLLAGRVPLGELEGRVSLADLVRADLGKAVPHAPDDAIRVEILGNPPSADLAELTTPPGVPLANDTSYAVVSLPRSPLEATVHGIEQHLTAGALRDRLPIGTDVKVMGTRAGERVALAVAVATLAEGVAGPGDYRELVGALRDEVRAVATDLLGRAPEDLVVNPTDGPYLTVTGTSAEAGDDGQVGRGNGFDGLITPMRPQSREAVAGKNPVSHVGKTYHAVAHDVASRLIERPDVEEATVGLVSRIGAPVTHPRAVHVALAGGADRAVVTDVLDQCLGDWEGVRDRLHAGRYELF